MGHLTPQASTNRDDLRPSDAEPEHLLLTEIPPTPFPPENPATFWWTYFAGIMIETGTLSRLFIPALKNISHLCGMIDDYQEKLLEEGSFVEVAKKFRGEEYVDRVPNPLGYDLRRMYKEYDMLASSMGFTPFSSRVHELDATGAVADSKSASPPEVDFVPPDTIPMRSQVS